MRHVAVVGASLAGLSAAEALRDFGFDGQITLLDADPELPYDRPPLSKQLLLGQSSPEDLALRPRSWYDERGVQLRLGERVDAVDVTGRTLRLTGDRILDFDGLVIACGAAARALPGPSAPPAVASRIQRLRTLSDARRLRDDLQPGRHLIVVGAGFVGLEVAAAARKRGLVVTVLETAPTPLNRVFGPVVGGWFVDLHERHGVQMRCGVEVAAIESAAEKLTVTLRGGQRLGADIVLAGVGADPATGWLAGSGVSLGNGVRCQADLSTSVAGIVAAGDVACWPNPLFGECMRVEHWTNATEQGRHAAATLLGERAPYEAVPYFWTDQYEAKARFVGRAAATDVFAVDVPKPNALIALYGRHGLLRGAVCINAPRRLAQYRDAIRERMPWDVAVAGLTDCPKPAYPTGTAVVHHLGGRSA